MKHKQYVIGVVWVFALVCLRVVPHVANFVPLLALTCYFSPKLLSKKTMGLITLFGFLLSDCLLSLLTPFSAIGSWTVFTYSGILAVICLSRQNHLSLVTFSSVLGYWIWTNFGVFLYSDLYPHSVTGLIACYAAALPFLKHDLFANLVMVFLLNFSNFKVSCLYKNQPLTTAS